MNPIVASLVLLGFLLAGCVSHTSKPGAEAAEAVNTHFDVTRNVVYTPPGWPAALTADIYVPREPGHYPGIVVVHGGGWDGRDRSDMDSISEKLARRGYVVANIDYRLAPDFLYPAPLEDTRASIEWLRANASRLKLDPERIGAWGYSAGAHLVTLAATFDPAHESRLLAVVAGGLPSDLTQYPDSPIITKFIGGPYREKKKTWIEASPLHHVSNNSPPIFLYHGNWDRLVHVEDAVAMKGALESAGVPVDLYRINGSGHISTFLLGFGAERAGIEFLDQHLRRGVVK